MRGEAELGTTFTQLTDIVGVGADADECLGDCVAESYLDHDATVADWRLKKPESSWLPELVGAVGSLKGKRVLDCGCGSGRYTEQLQQSGAIAIGLDLDRSSLELAKNQDGVGSIFAEARLEELPIASGTADVVLMRYVIHQIPVSQRDDVLAEVRRVLTGRGRVAIEVCYREQALAHFDHRVFQPLRQIVAQAYPSRQQLLGALGAHGLTVLQEKLMVRKRGQHVSLEVALSNSERLVVDGRGPSTWRRLTQRQRERFHEARAQALPRMFPSGLVPRDWHGMLVVAER